MTLDAITNEILGLFALFGKLGFKPTELHIGMDPQQIFVQVTSQEKSFLIIVAPFKGEDTELKAAWEKKAEWWNELSQEKREKFWQKSRARLIAVQVITGMSVKGFRFANPLKEHFGEGSGDTRN